MPRTLGRKKPAIKNEASLVKRKRGSGPSAFALQ
jgi:hypothetical protein